MSECMEVSWKVHSFSLRKYIRPC